MATQISDTVREVEEYIVAQEEHITSEIPFRVMTADELKIQTIDSLAKYIGKKARINYIPNYDDCLRRSYGIDYERKYEFVPTDTLYVFDSYDYHQDRKMMTMHFEHITDRDINMLWHINASNAGIVQFTNETNRFNILYIEFF